MLFNLFNGGHIDQRALLRFALQAIADDHCVDSSTEFFDEFVVDARLHVDSVGAHTGLAGIAVFAGHRTQHGGIDIGVVKDNERRVSAQFHRHFFDRVGTLLQQDLTDLG